MLFLTGTTVLYIWTARVREPSVKPVTVCCPHNSCHAKHSQQTSAALDSVSAQSFMITPSICLKKSNWN